MHKVQNVKKVRALQVFGCTALWPHFLQPRSKTIKCPSFCISLFLLCWRSQRLP